jgi:hypothetical protein
VSNVVVVVVLKFCCFCCCWWTLLWHECLLNFVTFGSKKLTSEYCYTHFLPRGRDRSVGIVTRYELDGPGIESLWERDIPRLCIFALGLTQTPVQWVWVLPGGTAGGAWRWSPITSIAEVKEGVELYLYILLWAFVACYRVNFAFILLFLR